MIYVTVTETPCITAPESDTAAPATETAPVLPPCADMSTVLTDLASAVHNPCMTAPEEYLECPPFSVL